jgi:hypothetical protein
VVRDWRETIAADVPSLEGFYLVQHVTLETILENLETRRRYAGIVSEVSERR